MHVMFVEKSLGTNRICKGTVEFILERNRFSVSFATESSERKVVSDVTFEFTQVKNRLSAIFVGDDSDFVVI